MSLILPGNLSAANSSRNRQHNTAGPLPGALLPPERESDFKNDGFPWCMGNNVAPGDHSGTGGDVNNTLPSAVDPYASLGFDQYGTELGKDARVWKVYVNETDRWDAELVDGWNKSLDVTLIFAALFSAISTAFIIESTKGLKEDPADTTSQTLSKISEILYAIANSSSSPGGSLIGAPKATGFTASHSMVAVNTLWYLSLSISIATSFLAILAKDWCHSFMANRNGHPCIQARRRQRKWTKIERWRMKELIAALPLLIHIALLLFTVGLCIYLWDMNTTVAIPVICVTGGAILFYAGSTLAAVMLDSFPYTTIVSRMLGWVPLKCLYVVTAAVVVIPTLILLLAFVAITSTIGERVGLNMNLFNHYLDSLIDRWWNFIHWLDSNPWVNKQTETPSQDEVASQALSWIIKHCQAPQAVDIALQAIAGASERLPRQPLEDCRASTALSRHLASCSPYKGEASNDQRISLYVRALSYLGFEDRSQNAGDLEVVLWDLQAENKRKVAELLSRGEFTPDDHNLAALRIDSMTTSQYLSLLKGGNEDGTAVLKSILMLLRNHADKSSRLHPAAYLSVLNTATLLSACIPNSELSAELFGLCYRLLDDSPSLHHAFRLIILALLQGRPSYPTHSDAGPTLASVHALGALQVYLACQLDSTEIIGRFIWFGTLEIMSNPSRFKLSHSDARNHNRILDQSRSITAAMMDALPLPIDYYEAPGSAELLALPIIQSLNQVYTTALVGVPDGRVYMFVVECMLCVVSNPIDSLCWSIMCTFPFPKPSVELIGCLERRSLVRVFHKNMEDSDSRMKFFAAAQLWLLIAIYHAPPTLISPEFDPARLLALLKQSPLLTDDESSVRQARDRLGLRIEQLHTNIWWGEGPQTVYALRVLECVLQSRGCAPSDPRWEGINKGLAETPAVLRGLGSFTAFPMRQPYSYEPPSESPNTEHVSIQVDNEGANEAQEGSGGD